MMKQAGLIALVGLGLTFSAAAQAQTTKRAELAKGDLTGTNMEVVVGVVEAAPGASAVLHTHAGAAAFYVRSAAGEPMVPGHLKISRDHPSGICGTHPYMCPNAPAV